MTEKTLITPPVWRLIALLLMGGGLILLGRWAGLWSDATLDFVSTMLAAAMFFGISFWARRRPDKLAIRLGAFAKIGDAIKESADDISALVHRQTMRVGIAVGLIYGAGVATGRIVFRALLEHLRHWEVAASIFLLLAAVVVAPDLWRYFRSRAAVPDEEESEAVQ